MAITRRGAILGATAAAIGLGAAASWVLRVPPAQAVMTPPELLSAVEAGSVILVDIRRPDEWEATGIARGAVPIDMRQADFALALEAARADAGGVSVAVICARGVRSRRLTQALTEAGIGPIIDVPEGMLGSSDGPGWIARGLPVVTWKPS